ncbi:alpha-mannosidase, partial [Paenibacillus sp. AR247]
MTLTRSAKAGERFEVAAEACAGHSGIQPVLGESQLCFFEEEIYQFYIDLECLVQVRNHIDPDSLRAAEIDRGLTEVVRTIDWGLAKDALMDNVRNCRQRMAPLLECVNGST